MSAVTACESQPSPSTLPPGSPADTDGPKTDDLVPIRGALIAAAIGVGSAALALSVIGFTGSYRSMRDLAESWGWGWFAGLFPIGIDVGIVGLIAADLFLSAIRTPAPVLRYFAWVLTAATIVFNAASGWPAHRPAGWGDVIEAAAHATMPLLVVVITDAIRRAIMHRGRIATGHAFESFGVVRWCLAPWQTFTMWRRMRLWGVHTIAGVLELERARLALRDELRERYGRRWRREASAEECRRLREVGRGLLPTTPPPPPPLPPAASVRAGSEKKAEEKTEAPASPDKADKPPARRKAAVPPSRRPEVQQRGPESKPDLYDQVYAELKAAADRGDAEAFGRDGQFTGKKIGERLGLHESSGRRWLSKMKEEYEKETGRPVPGLRAVPKPKVLTPA